MRQRSGQIGVAHRTPPRGDRGDDAQAVERRAMRDRVGGVTAPARSADGTRCPSSRAAPSSQTDRPIRSSRSRRWRRRPRPTRRSRRRCPGSCTSTATTTSGRSPATTADGSIRGRCAIATTPAGVRDRADGRDHRVADRDHVHAMPRMRREATELGLVERVALEAPRSRRARRTPAPRQQGADRPAASCRRPARRVAKPRDERMLATADVAVVDGTRGSISRFREGFSSRPLAVCVLISRRSGIFHGFSFVVEARLQLCPRDPMKDQLLEKAPGRDQSRSIASSRWSCRRKSNARASSATCARTPSITPPRSGRPTSGAH